MIPIGTVIDSPQTGERLTIRSTADSSNGALFQAELVAQPGTYVVGAHVHPSQEERFVVLEGRYGYKVGDTTGVAGPGETIVCPIGVVHSQWNAGSTPMRIYYEHRPALPEAEVFFETYFGLSRDGLLNPDGSIPLLRAAVLIAEVGNFIRPPAPPQWVQAVVFPVLALIGRTLGYRARYERYAAKG